MQDAVININGNSIQTLEMIFLMTAISLLPFFVLMMTCFTRVIIVLSFTRSAMGVQATPPNAVLIGIALFLTMFIMSPVIDEVTEVAYVPYRNDEITQYEALQRASVPMKEFMLRQTEDDTLAMFMEYAQIEEVPDNPVDLPLRIVVPSFIPTELQRALLVSSTLMSMGMIMLPPAMMSLPFKLLLFITLNGWDLLFSTLIEGFN